MRQKKKKNGEKCYLIVTVHPPVIIKNPFITWH